MKDKRNMAGVLRRFKEFLINQGKPNLAFAALTPELVEAFRDDLIKDCKGEGAGSYFARFKKMLKAAKRQKIISINPGEEVKNKMGKAKERDVLTLRELEKLARTDISNQEVRRAFLFTCSTGLRWVDVKALRWSAIRGDELKVVQEKTQREISLILNDTAQELLGTKGKTNDLIFDLPTANGANKDLKEWVKKAKIDKHITWHCGRHSLGTNLALNDTDFLTIARTLGHSTTKYTERYVKKAEEMSKKALDKVNFKI
jgi:integrase